MLFQIIQPFVADIYGDSFKEAVKNYVKFNHDVNITNMIIKHQSDHYETRLRYYIENNKNKVGIDVYPYTNVSYPLLPAQIVTSNNPISIVPSIISSISPHISPSIVSSPIVTVKGSNYSATDKGVFINNPFIY